MMCAGLTAFSSLVHFGSGFNQGPTSQKLKGLLVGIVGIGGVGYFALFAKALGAQRVVAFSKVENAGSLDLIFCTISSSNMPLPDYITLLKRDGSFCQLGLPDGEQFKVDAGPYLCSAEALLGFYWGRQAKSERCSS